MVEQNRPRCLPWGASRTGTQTRSAAFPFFLLPSFPLVTDHLMKLFQTGHDNDQEALHSLGFLSAYRIENGLALLGFQSLTTWESWGRKVKWV